MLWTSYLHALSEVDVHVPALACIRIYNLVASRSGLLIWCARVAACPRLLVVRHLASLKMVFYTVHQAENEAENGFVCTYFDFQTIYQTQRWF